MKHPAYPRRNIVSLSALLITVIFLCTAVPVFSLAGQQSKTLRVTGEYYTVGNAHRIWNSDFDDSWFTGNPSEYSHQIARVSLLMAVSAVRDLNVPAENRDQRVWNFLSGAGFTDLRSDGYSEETAANTVSTVIGQKKIGDMTLIAVAICGGNYKKEWAGNMDVGSDLRHEGFRIASEKVQQRIRDYLEEEELNGKLRLWISGYSRAAAISNITAADMTDSGLFNGVFAYTFATPRTTREKNKKEYDNIFNIVGANDPVPMIPLADWDYSRYGRDLFTPAQETDGRFLEKKQKADDIALKLTGKPFRNSPPINNTLRIVLDYIYAIVPTPESYVRSMQPAAISVMNNTDSEQQKDAIFSILEEMEALSDTQQEEIGRLSDYLQQFASDFLVEDNPLIDQGYWDPEAPLADNIMHEHNFDVYLEWMFSADSEEELFTRNPSVLRFTVRGEHTRMCITDEYGFVAMVDNDAKATDIPADIIKEDLTRSEDAPDPDLYVERSGLQTIISLPRDSDYLITLWTDKPETITYFASLSTTDSVRRAPTDVFSLNAEPDETYFVMLDKKPADPDLILDGNANNRFQVWNKNLPYSPSLVTNLENANVFHLTVTGVVGLVFFLVGILLIALIVSIILWIVRLIRHKKRSAVITIVMHLLFAAMFFLIEEMVRSMLGRIVPLQAAARGAICLTLLLLALRGTLINKNRRNRLVLASLALFTVADILQTLAPAFRWIIGPAGMLVLALAYISDKKPSLKQTVAGLILLAVSCAAAFLLRKINGMPQFNVILYGIVMAAAVTCSLTAKKPFLIGTVLLVVSETMLFAVRLTDSLSLPAYTLLLCFYTGNAFLASSVWEHRKHSDSNAARKPDDPGAEPEPAVRQWPEADQE